MPTSAARRAQRLCRLVARSAGADSLRGDPFGRNSEAGSDEVSEEASGEEVEKVINLPMAQANACGRSVQTSLLKRRAFQYKLHFFILKVLI